MDIDIAKIFADWLAVRADVKRAGTTPASGYVLWAHVIEEAEGQSLCADPCAVIRTFGGDRMSTAPVARCGLQVFCVGTQAAATHALARKLHAACFDEQLPILGAEAGEAVDLIILDVLGATLPAQLGRDERGRIEVVFNVQVAYRQPVPVT
jgi:hypothetical protein